MNLYLLQPEVQKFIIENIREDSSKLLFKGSPFEHISVQELVEQIISKKKAAQKIPTWFHTKNIYYPNKLNIEQASSEKTALYKSQLISGASFIDITGGFGIDDFYLSKRFSSGVHCELNENLSAIVQHNFAQLGVSNMSFYSGDGVDYLLKNNTVYDWIYSDPSRRSESKGKVFLLSDCQPDIPSNLNHLFEKSDNILLKLSPVLDIASAIRELQFTKEIHVVAANNEVKELLFILAKNFTGEIEIKAINLIKEKTDTFSFVWNKTTSPDYAFPMAYLYEPNAAILKSGAFTQVATQLQLKKLHKHSHLYTSSEFISFPGRSFKILEVTKYDKKVLRRLLGSKKANISVRNFPESVAQIRKKTKIMEGGDHYLFFTTAFDESKIVIVCQKA